MAVDAEFIRDAASELVPPSFRPKNAWERWALAIAVAVVVEGCVMTWHVAQACGFLTWMGLGGFAMAADVSQQQATLTQIQVSQVMREVRDAKTKVCVAQQQKNQLALDSWSRQLSADEGTYYSLTHSWPAVMTCDELLISPPT